MSARSSLRSPRRARGTSPTGPVLLRSKLRPPPVRAGLVPRARLDATLEAGTRGRLCLVDAPAGSGKTTLLAQWCLADQASRSVAWVSLDESDDDPVRFWVYVIEAFRVVEPGIGEDPLALLQGSGSADVLTQVVLPQLLNELATSGVELSLLLDDYHLISSSTCHDTLGFFVDHLPANVHVVLSTRVDPPLPLARLRASGELTELHQVRMEFAYDGGGLGKGGEVRLFVDGEKVGEGRVAATAAMVFSADDTCDVGLEGGSVVSEDYGPRGNEFTGEVNWVQIDLDEAAEDLDHLITPEERLHIAMARQ